MFTGEAIQSTQNIEKPLGSRGSAPNPAGGAHSAPPEPLAGGRGLAKTPSPLSALPASDGAAFSVTPTLKTLASPWLYSPFA